MIELQSQITTACGEGMTMGKRLWRRRQLQILPQ